MGSKKNGLKDKYYFSEIKYSKTSLTTTMIWRPLYKLTLNVYSLLLFQLPFSSSFESLFHQTNIRDSAVIRTQAFSVAQNVPKWRQSVKKRSFSHGKVQILLGDPLSRKRAPENYRRRPIWLSLANFYNRPWGWPLNTGPLYVHRFDYILYFVHAYTVYPLESHQTTFN